jgi:hypothetical protein
MATVLDKGIASKLRNSLQATPGVSRDQVQAFGALLVSLQKPGVTAADAERQLRDWAAKAPRHAVSVARSVAIASTYMRTLAADSWILKAFGASGKPR